MLDFDTFLESLEHVPPEFERNFNLIKDLDSRTSELIDQVNDLIKKYKETRLAQERRKIKADIDGLMEKMTSYAHDKIELATQTYDLVDKNIKSLLVISKQAEEASGPLVPQVLPGYDMPIDVFEPLYCYCRKVSFGEMVACDNAECPIEWFHLACVGLTKAPGSKVRWFCKECQSTRETPKKQERAPSRKTPKRK